MHKLMLNPKYKNLENNLINIKDIFIGSDNTIHKARNELKIIEIEGIKCVVKSFKVPHLINRIAYTFFRYGKARKSYLNAMKLTELGVSTPEPMGIIEFFNDGLLCKSFYISLYEPYDFTIREIFHHKIEDYQEILKQFAKFTYDIHQKGVLHVDYSLGNILIAKKEDYYKFSLVDINRMQFKEISAKEGLRNFNKFWAKDSRDLLMIAKEYARLADLDEERALKIIIKEAKSLEAKINLKRTLKGR